MRHKQRYIGSSGHSSSTQTRSTPSGSFGESIEVESALTMGVPEADGELVRVNGGASPSRKAHLLIIPFEDEGHHSVFLQLLYFLSSFDIVVTFCTSERRVKQLRQLLSEGEFKSLDLRLVLLAGDDSNVVKGGNSVQPGKMSDILKVPFRAYLENLAVETDPNAKPTCLVADIFLGWSDELAAELMIPRYLMFPTAGWLPYAALKVEVEGAMEIGPDKTMEIPGQLRAWTSEIPAGAFPLLKFHNLAGILINSFEELEGEQTVEAIRGYLQRMPTTPGSKVARFLPVGPLVHIPGYLSSVPTKDDSGQKSKAFEWLDEQAPSSVIYVAFGSKYLVPDSLIYELARGLELSGVPFLWAFRHSNSNDYDVSSLLPPGFLDRTKTLGYVEFGWAPQLKILQHPSTGGFLSACGWSSFMESLSSGIPLLAWPRHGEEPCNATLIVDELKVGLRICKRVSKWVRESGRTEAVPGEEVAAAIKSLMIDDKGKELQKNAIRFKELAWGSMQDGGSSHRNLQQFVDEILTT